MSRRVVGLEIGPRCLLAAVGYSYRSVIDRMPAATTRCCGNSFKSELKCRDQQRYIRLHREAAEIWQRRGDLNAACRHLNLIGDIAAASNLVLAPALVRRDRGDLAGLARAVQPLPGAMKVDDPALAMETAALCFLAGDRTKAARWCDRAEELTTLDNATLQLRLHFGRATIALYDGDVNMAASRGWC